MLRLLPRDSECRCACARETRNASLAMETAACTSHHGRAPERTGRAPVPCPYRRHGPTTGSAARCTRAPSSNAAPYLQTQRAPVSLRRVVTRGACLALEAPACSSYHESARKKKSGLWPARCSFMCTRLHKKRGTTRALSKLKCCVSSQETASAGASTPRDTPLAWRWSPQLARPTTGARRWREASRRRSALRRAISRPQPARHGARAQLA